MRMRVALLGAVTLSQGCAGYGDLAREIDAYEPPALYGSEVGRSQETSRGVPSASEAEFQAQLARLDELKAKWQRALEAPGADESFYVPEASKLDALRPAAADDSAAERALGDGFSLETLEALALLRNPAVKGKERELRAALEQYSQVANLDAVLRRYSVFTAGLMTGVGDRENPDAMAVKFPFPGVTALKGEVVTQEARAVREEVEIARREAVTSARKVHWELLYNRSAQETTAQMLDLLEHLKGAASARYESGATNFQDIIKVNVEREKTREESRTLGEEQRNMEAEIREILSLPATTRIGAPEYRDPIRDVPRLEALYPAALERRQEVRRMRAMIAKMDRMIAMAQTMIYPRVSLNLSLYERDEVSRVGSAGMETGGGGSFPVTTTASMGQGLPKMPWFGRDDAYLRETQQRLEALKNDLRMEEASTVFRVREAWFKLDKASREESLFRERIVTLSQAALEASTRGYSAGRVMFADLIESYTGWLQANLSARRAQADLGVGRAALEAAVGTTALTQ